MHLLSLWASVACSRLSFTFTFCLNRHTPLSPTLTCFFNLPLVNSVAKSKLFLGRKKYLGGGGHLPPVAAPQVAHSISVPGQYCLRVCVYSFINYLTECFEYNKN